MAARQSYTFEQLVEIYRHYAQLKGWSIKDATIKGKVEAWMDSRIGAVGLAIDFHESHTDGAKHLGYDAEAREGDSPIQQLSVTLAGTEHANRDGTSRQGIARECSTLEILRLRHEPDNKFDASAVGVFRKTGEQLGYLPKRLAAETVARIKQGYKHAAVITEVKSGNKLVVNLSSGQSVDADDVAIMLFIVKPDVQIKEWQEYYRAWIAKIRREVSRGRP